MTANVESRWGADAVDTSGANLPALKASFLVGHAPARGAVCEIGSGEGKLLRTLARTYPELALHGCDVRVPQTPTDAYTFRQIEGNRLPFDDRSFDAVLVFDVLEHVPDPAATIAEAARMLKPGGQLVAFVPIEGETQSFYELYRRLLGRDTYAVTKEHIQAFTHDGLRALVERHFEVTRLEYAYHPLGHFMDASFFAAARLEFVREFWWKDNVYYASRASTEETKKKSLASRVMNGLLELGNLAAYAESKLLAHARVGAAGVLFTATVRG
jgi:SAM-dependent methyltransferase